MPGNEEPQPGGAVPRQETVLSRSVPWHPEGGVTLALLASGLLIAWLCEGAFRVPKGI